MAPLPRSTVLAIKTWLYRWEIERLWRSFEAAQHALAQQRSRIETEMAERYAALEGTDDSDLLDDLDRDYAEFSGQELPALFLIGMYHAFERHAARWMGRRGDQVTFHEIATWSAHNGHVLHRPSLRAISLAANCAKHGAGHSAARLFKLRPEWFRDGTTVDDADNSCLQITAERLASIYEELRTISPHEVPSPV